MPNSNRYIKVCSRELGACDRIGIHYPIWRYGELPVSAEPKPRVRGSLLPLLVMLLLFLVADAFGFYLIQGSTALNYYFMGVFQAQAGIFCILGGTVGRSWIFSFLQATALGVISVLLLYFVAVSGNDVPMAELTILACGVTPILLFCGCMPFLVLRCFFGSHLSRETTNFAEPYSLRIEDFFLAMTVVAGLLAIAFPAFAFVTEDNGGELTTLLLIVALSTVASTVAVVPVSLLYFRASTRRSRTGVLILFATLGLFAYGAFMLGYQLWNRADIWLAFQGSRANVLYLTTSMIVFSLGLIVLHWSGFRWRTFPKVNELIEPVDSPEHSQSAVRPSSHRTSNRIAAAGIVLASIALTFAISYLKQERFRLAEKLMSLNSAFLVDGGYVLHLGHKPFALQVPPTTLNSDLDLSLFNGLRRISLAGTQLTEPTLSSIGKIDSLVEIDFSKTGIADSAVKYLSRKRYIEKLSLAGTQFTVTGINAVMAGNIILTLDIGDLNLDDEALNQLQMKYISGLILRGNPVTDKSLVHLTTLTYLDLSRTQCDGAELDQLTSVASLILDETSVDDSAIAKLLASNSGLTRLSLRKTRVTDATLTTLAQYAPLMELELGDGEITADGLVAAAFAPTDRLALNARKFTGNVFDAWKPTIRRLDMSRSGVSDSDVQHLGNVWNLQELSLAHCNVSDASLTQHAALNLTKIDLTGTKVTAAMVAKIFPKKTLVYIGATQCSPEEIAHPDQPGSMRIGIPFDLMP